MMPGLNSLILHDGTDEVRLYNAVVAPPATAPRYVAQGIFRSPLYVPDAPLRLAQAQWTGVFPPGGGIAVSVAGYADASGASPLGAPLPLGPQDAVADLSALGDSQRLRSFRYEVVLDGSPSVDEPALFESIWLTLRRQGVSPAWTSWSAR